MAVPILAYPGLLLGSSSQYLPGPGTHIYESNIYASLSGRPIVLPSKSSTTEKTTGKVSKSLPEISVPRLTSSNTLPQVNSIVLCRVTRIQSRQVTVEILVVDDQVCKDSWQGVVRKEDVRGWEIDKVVMAEAFRVGDLVRGVVVSLIFSQPSRTIQAVTFPILEYCYRLQST